MKTYAERKVFKPLEIDIWSMAKDFVDQITFHDCRCHELARAVCMVLQAQSPPIPVGTIYVEDGKVGPVDHSWIRIDGTNSVLDVYRPGCIPGVLLLDFMVARDYVAGEARTDIRESELRYLLAQLGYVGQLIRNQL